MSHLRRTTSIIFSLTPCLPLRRCSNFDMSSSSVRPAFPLAWWLPRTIAPISFSVGRQNLIGSLSLEVIRWSGIASFGAQERYGEFSEKKFNLMVASEISSNVAGDQAGLSRCFSISTAVTPVRKSGLAPFYRDDFRPDPKMVENTSAPLTQ